MPRPAVPALPPASWLAAGLAACGAACIGSDGAGARSFSDPFAFQRVADEPPSAAGAPASPIALDDASLAERRAAEPPLQGIPAPAALSSRPQSTGRVNAAPPPAVRDEVPPPSSALHSRASADADAPQQGAVLTDPTRRPPAADPDRPFRVEGRGLPPLAIPRDEKLIYDVSLNLGVISPTVGKVTMVSKVEPFRTSPILLATADAAPAGEQATISAHAEGQYAVYTLDELITTTHLPQRFPALLHRSAQSGTENRNRELTLGYKDEAFVSVYRRDIHCRKCSLKTHFVEPTWAWQDPRHCDGCKRPEHRVWKDPVSRPAPQSAVDMISAVYVARTMVLEGRTSAEFQLMDKDELWDVTLKRGRSTRRIEVPAGEFEAYEITLETRVPKSESGREASDFSGLFGIHGQLSIWVEARSGVPVWIRGIVPVGPIDLDVGVVLAGFRGTPRDFRPLE